MKPDATESRTGVVNCAPIRCFLLPALLCLLVPEALASQARISSANLSAAADPLVTYDVSGATGSDESDPADAVSVDVGGGALVCPYLAFGAATSCMRGYGHTLSGRLHAGYDMGGVPPGTAIRSASDGRVIFSKYAYATGWTVVVQDPGGYGHVYGHMGSRRLYDRPDRRPPGMVGRGQWVAVGDPIGPVGNTGRIVSRHRIPGAGTHLHYALIDNTPELLQAIARAGLKSGRHLGLTLDATTTLVSLPASRATGSALWAHATLAPIAAGTWALWDTARVISVAGPDIADTD